MSAFVGRVCVVTGAGSGMGRELAVQLAEAGAKLALSDVDTIGLAKTVRIVESLGAEVISQPLDVTQREEVLAYADTVVEHYGRVNQVYNNAGIAYHGSFTQSGFKEFDRVMDVNFFGVVNGTKAFLPHVLASGDGHIINTSSLFGLLSMPGETAYNASKFAVRGFTEALREEMLVTKSPVRVTCVHPGGIKTAIARNAVVGPEEDMAAFVRYFDRYLARTRAKVAARIVLRAVRRNHARVLVGYDAKLLDAWVRLMGSYYQRWVTVIMPLIIPKAMRPAKYRADEPQRALL